MTTWDWTEPLVWTKRMLAALESGVKGGKWYSLIDKLHPEATLRAAFAQVKANRGAAGVDTRAIWTRTPAFAGAGSARGKGGRRPNGPPTAQESEHS